MVSWNWDEFVDESGMAHESVANTDNSDATSLKKSYSYQAPPLMDGLVGWWPLSWSSAVDLSENNNDGTINGATTGVSGVGGLHAYSFDGVDDYITVSSPSGLDNATITQSVWIYPRISEGTVSDIQSFVRFTLENSGSLFVRTYGSNNGGTAETVPLNEWSHIAFTWDVGNEIQIFLNGSLIQTYSTTDTGTTTNDLYLGQQYNSSFYLNGKLSDFRFYNRILSDAEIQTLYEWGNIDVARPATDGISYYPLDGDATDSWGSNDGTVNGATVTSDAIRGQAYSFDGTDDIDTGIGADIETGNFTLSAWVKPNENPSTGKRIISNDGNKNGWALSYGDAGEDSIRFFLRGMDSVILDATGVAPLNEWISVVAVFDGSNNKRFIYINGDVSAHISSDSGTPNNDSTNIHIGSDSNNNYFNGIIDDVRIYDRALSPSEVHELFQWGTFGRDMRDVLVRA